MDDNTVGMDIDPDLAAAMGFASFGSSKGSRKLGSRETPRHSRPKDFGTDANRVELGRRKRQAGIDECAIEGISESHKPSCFTSMTPGANMTDPGPRKRRAEHHDMDPASKTAYTSDVPTESNHAEMVTAQPELRATTSPQEDGPRHSASVIGGHGSVPAESPKKKKGTVPTGLAAFLARGKELPENPLTGPSNITPDSAEANIPTASLPETSNVQTASTSVEPDLQALRNGIRNESGDIAYFLPSFIEDPWIHLEKGSS